MHQWPGCDIGRAINRRARRQQQLGITAAADDARFDHAVDQQLAGGAGNVVGADVPFQQIAARHHDFQVSAQPEITSLQLDLPASHILLAGSGIDINFPQHRESA